MAHAFEAGLICQARAEQAEGRQGITLALATAAVRARPSLGLAYAMVLFGTIFCYCSLRGRWSNRSALGRDAFGPALLTGTLSITWLGLTYGVEPLI